MFSFAATDAGKGKTNASKAIPAGLSEDPQAEWKELPVCHRKWKASTDMVETNRLEVHLVRPLGEKLMQEITRSELQTLLDDQARSCGRSMVDHLRFRL